jgi:hypothetical protein
MQLLTLISRRFVLLGVPLLQTILTLTHGTNPLDNPSWWLTQHITQLALFGLLGLAVYLLGRGLTGTTILISRGAIAIYAVAYAAYDTFAGVSTGQLALFYQTVSAQEQAVVSKVIEAFFTSPITIGFFAVGTLAWTIGVLALAVGLYRARTSLVPVIILVASGLLLLGDHTFPFGTMAFGAFFFAALWLEFFATQPSRTTRIDSSEVMI